jgi:hypothetical protein
MMSYSYPGAPACSMCKENGNDVSKKCMDMIDCLESKYPCTKATNPNNCYTNCLNTAQGDSIVDGCANALVSAACP